METPDDPDYQPPWWFRHYRASKAMTSVKPWEWDPCPGEWRESWLWRVSAASAAEYEAWEAKNPKKQ